MFLGGWLFEWGGYCREKEIVWHGASFPPHSAAPLMMNQVDAEMGYSGSPALMQQQPATVADDTISGADLVCQAVLSCITLPFAITPMNPHRMHL